MTVEKMRGRRQRQAPPPRAEARSTQMITLQLEVRPNQRPPPPQLRHERLERP